MVRKYFKGIYLPAMLGGSIEFYDLALYGYMAPILVHVFWPQLEKTTAYFFYFSFPFFASFCQWAGALFFGAIGDKYGRKRAMYSSMLGISCVTFLICLLPTYAQMGWFATLFFLLMRSLQSFFFGGEYNGGAIYCLEHEKQHKNNPIVSGLYCAFTVTGLIAASAMAFLCYEIGGSFSFRLAYGLSFVFAVITFKLRSSIRETPVYREQKANVSVASSSHSGKPILRLIIVSSFLETSYGLPTKIFNALLPLAVPITSSQIMLLNTFLLILYGFLLVLFGFIAQKYGSRKTMLCSTFLTFLLAFFLMKLIKSGYFFNIILAKTVFITLAASFIAPFHSFAQDLSPAQTRYQSISTSYAIGRGISTLFLSGSFLIYKYFQDINILGSLLSFAAIITMSVVYQRKSEI